jgi:bifunctional aspartokinase / homoserine dehydrogenase 1
MEDVCHFAQDELLCASLSSLLQATVGAGLPIIATLKHLRETGDRIISIEGVFSGTLSYLFNMFGTDDRPFSDHVKQAQQAGFTEPDPRDDLSGMDVARKVSNIS